MRRLLVLFLMLAPVVHASETTPVEAEPAPEGPALPEVLTDLLDETDDDDNPILTVEEVRGVLDGMPDHVLELLEQQLDDSWINSAEQLRTLLKSAPSPQAIELALQDHCILCHTDPGEQSKRHLFSHGPTGAGQFDLAEIMADVHFRKGLSCAGCHGGDPEAYDHSDDMLERWPNSRRERQEDRRWIPEFCSSCHADATVMRRFNPSLPTDQLAKYRVSHHGRLLLEEGDSKAAQCVSCHGVHGIRGPDSRLSMVHAERIPETCGHCHADADYMAGYVDKYGRPLPTDQLDQYRISVHGQALLENGDLGAPACNDCHGNHAALPPEVASVSQVCRNCHLAQGQLFDGSPHKKAFAENDWPECGRCHGNHAIEYPDDSWIGDTPGTVCHDCHSEHAADSPECDETAAHFRDEIAALVGGRERLVHAAVELREKGLDTESLEAVGVDLEDNILQVRTKIHSFERSTFDQTAEQGVKLVERGEELVTEAEEEFRFRVTGLSVSIAVMVLLATALWFKLREYETR
jgi:hypothetical protein